MDKKSALENLYSAIYKCRECPKVIPSQLPRRVLENSIDVDLALMAQAPSEKGVRLSAIHWNKVDGTLTAAAKSLEKYLNKIGYSVNVKK